MAQVVAEALHARVLSLIPGDSLAVMVGESTSFGAMVGRPTTMPFEQCVRVL